MKSEFKIRFTFLAIAIAGLLFTGCGDSPRATEEIILEPLPLTAEDPIGQPAPILGFRVVDAFPHDTDAFTQGLLINNGRLFESTGLRGESSVREVELATGEVLQQQDLDSALFGEGLALRDGQLIQLTLTSGQALTWTQNELSASGQLSTRNPAWGLTLMDNDTFAFSDGTSTLRFLDPVTLQEISSLTVTDNGTPVTLLNELEFIDGLIYANRFTTDEIVAIDPTTGFVSYRIDLTGIIDKEANNLGPNDVLNGIAYDVSENRLLVTGKRWPSLFHIELVQ